MAQRDRPAVDVDSAFVQSELLAARQHLGREGLVQLEQVDVLHAQPGLLQHLAHRQHRGDERCPSAPRRWWRRRRCGPAAWCPAARRRGRSRPPRAAAPSLSIEALPAVTVPPSRKDGFSFASASTVVSGRMPSSRLTDLRLGAAADRDRHDLGREGAALPGRGGALLALGGEAVLLGAR